jgi:DNA-binding transcriptional LysR family regulator
LRLVRGREQGAPVRSRTHLVSHLFHRERSRIHITELGRIVQPYLQEAWENTQVAKRQAKDYVSTAPTQLKLAIMCTIAPALLIQLFARFRSSRPDVKLELIDGTAQSVEEQLVASAAEIAIYCRPDRTPDSRLNYLPLFREQMMIVLPSKHRLVSRDQIEISDLAGERYVQRSFCEFNDVVDSVFDARGVDCETLPPRSRRLGAGDDRKRLRIRLLPEVFDIKPRCRCQAACQSGVLAGSKPDDGEGKAIFACCRYARP